MPHKSLTFNGERKSWIYLLEGRQKPPFPPVNNNLLRIPGMPGAHIQASDTDVLYIIQPIGYVVEDDEDFLAKKDELAEWLITKEPVELQFDDEPGRIYYAKIDGGMDDFTRFEDQRKGTITFLCPDPYSYGPEKQVLFPSDNVLLTNAGTADADPTFELEVTAPITFAMIQNQLGEYMMIGKPTPAGNSIVDRYTTIMTNEASTLVGWSDGTTLEDGLITGTMGSSDGKFRATDYGTGSGWHGPAIKQSLSNPLQDFNLQVNIEFNEAKANEMGRIQVHLLDVSNNIVGMVSFFDLYANWFDAVGRSQMGVGVNKKIIVSDRGINWDGYFVGRLTMQRKGQEFITKISRYNAYLGIYQDTIEGVLTDYNNEHQTPIAQVQVHFGAYGTNLRPYMTVDKIQVLQVNDVNQNQIPILADVGDKLTFDHKNEIVYLNGEDIKKEKVFGADYFKLKPGENQLIVLPQDSFDTTANYRERFQ